MGESWNAYGVFMVKPEGKRPIAGYTRRLEDTIKMDLEEI